MFLRKLTGADTNSIANFALDDDPITLEPATGKNVSVECGKTFQLFGFTPDLSPPQCALFVSVSRTGSLYLFEYDRANEPANGVASKARTIKPRARIQLGVTECK